MISMAKSFEQNIADGNQRYEKFCISLIETGKIDDKFVALMNTDDIVNIVMLSVIRCYDFASPERCRKFGLTGHNITIRTAQRQRREEVSNISNLYSILPQNIKEQNDNEFWIRMCSGDELGCYKSVF